MDELATALTKQGLSRCDRRELYRYRQFYILYPQIVETVSPQLRIEVMSESALDWSFDISEGAPFRLLPPRGGGWEGDIEAPVSLQRTPP